MAVTVIKKGPGPKVVLKQCVCGHCGSTLEYAPADVQRHDGPDVCEWIDCPECKARVVVRLG